MKTIKLIDLFIKIANGEELPEKIIFKNELYTLKKWENIEETDYLCESTGNLLGEIYLKSLNEDVQIIEDTPAFKGFKVKNGEIIYKEDKKIKRIEERESGWWPNMADGNVSTLKQAINEIIDKINGDEK